MSAASGLALLMATRKSRKDSSATEDEQYARQTHGRSIERAEAEGHKVVKTVGDTVSSQSLPWERRNLKKWMTDPVLLATWDALFVTETDRLARMDDRGFHYIEHWLYEHNKSLVTAEGVMFPPRDDSDRYQWLGLKRRARTYWEDVRDKHASTRTIIRANGGAIGLAPFGYTITGDKYARRFVIDSIEGPLAREAFRRIADGRTATSVAEWLSEVAPTARNGKPRTWRVKRVIDMIARRTYLGERDGFEYEALVSVELFNSANAAQATRSCSTGGRRGVHAYSGVILCECGAPLYHHRSTRDGKAVGAAYYRCARGRRGISGEAKCSAVALAYERANLAVDAYLLEDNSPERVMMTTGGNHGKLAELARIDSEMRSAMARKDMASVASLAAKYAEANSAKTEPILTVSRKTGRTRAECWLTGSLGERRSILGDVPVTVTEEAGALIARYAADAEE